MFEYSVAEYSVAECSEGGFPEIDHLLLACQKKTLATFLRSCLNCHCQTGSPLNNFNGPRSATGLTNQDLGPLFFGERLNVDQTEFEAIIEDVGVLMLEFVQRYEYANHAFVALCFCKHFASTVSEHMRVQSSPGVADELFRAVEEVFEIYNASQAK